MKRILIADPDPAFRKALSLLITRKLEIRLIDEAADTGSLIQKLADTRPDLLLLSWSIHGVPGPETCILLRNTYPELKIILLGLYPEDAITAHAVGAGFICKAASPDETLEVLKSVLSDGEESGRQI
jgi:two-component system, NarL family, invasion response regulator UvrY